MASGTVGYTDTRGNIDWLSKIKNKIQDYLDGREEPEEKEQKSKGGAIVAVGDGNDVKQTTTNIFVKVDAGSGIGGNFFGKRLDQTTFYPDVFAGEMTHVGRSGNTTASGAAEPAIDIEATRVDEGPIVEELRKNTIAVLSVAGEIEDQSKIAQATLLNQKDTNRRALQASKVQAEKRQLKQGVDYSTTTAPKPLRDIMRRSGGLLPGGGGGAGLGLMGGIGLKRGASLAGKQIMKKGAGRAGTRALIKMGGRGLAKKAAKVGIRGVGKSLAKKIPLLGLGVGALFAAQRMASGDWGGALLELASGAASTFPGVGTAASVGLDAALMAKDLTGMQKGAVVNGPTAALLGEGPRGQEKELVTPLEGPRGQKVFKWFGLGWLKAMKENKGDYTDLQGEGLSNFWNKKGGFSSFGSFLSNITGGIGNFFTGAGENISKFWQETFVPGLKSMWEGTKENLSNVWSGTTEWVKNVWNGLGDNMNKLKQGIVNISNKTTEALANAYSWVAGGGIQDKIRNFTGGEEGDGVFTIGGLEIPNIFHRKNDNDTSHVEVSDSNRSVFDTLSDGQITRILTSSPGDTVEGVNVSTDLLKQLNQYQTEKNLGGVTPTSVTAADATNAASLNGGSSGMIVNNYYQTNAEGNEKAEATPNFSGPTDGHGDFLSAFSSLAIATL